MIQEQVSHRTGYGAARCNLKILEEIWMEGFEKPNQLSQDLVLQWYSYSHLDRGIRVAFPGFGLM